MIKAKINGPTGVFVVMGISAENVTRLKQGQPIFCCPIELDIAPGTRLAGITLFYGETDYDLGAQMRALIGPQTEVIVAARGDDKPQ